MKFYHVNFFFCVKIIVANVKYIIFAGAALFGYFDPLSLRVAMVISGDMAHTHLPSGPYGYSNASQPFDDVSSS